MPTRISPPTIALLLSLATTLIASPPAPPEPDPPATQPATSQKSPPAKSSYGKPITTAITPGKFITYKAADRDIKAYLVEPKLPAGQSPDASPAVILVHDIFGMTPFIKARADAIAKQGYTVIVPDLYSRLDGELLGGARFDAEKSLNANTAWLAYDKTSDQQAVADLQAACDYLEGPEVEGQPPSRRIGIVGYDMGGIYAMMMAGADLRITAAVNFYGRILYSSTSQNRPASPVESLFNLHAPLLSFYGTNDPQIPPAQLDALESRLSHNLSKTPYEVVKYPHIGHSFMVPGRQGYDASKATEASAKVRLFLADHLRAAPAKEE